MFIVMHQSKFLVCVNLLGNKADSDSSDYDTFTDTNTPTH